MRIAFICGCLEPGRDGVGDYTRHLAGELIRMGHECGAIALDDSSVEHVVADEQRAMQDQVPVLRLPSVMPWRQRIAIAKRWIDNFKPDWMSLQFVPYSFHPKGLPFGLGKRLKHLSPKANWHVMFHELWIGMEKGSPKSQRLVGYFQQRIISNLVQDLDSKVIHTQSLLYQSQLKLLGFSAFHLPLFGNIPVRMPEPIMLCDTNKLSISNSRKLRLVHFGAIRPNVPLANFVTNLSKYAEFRKVEITITLVGRAGQLAEAWKLAFESSGIHFKNHGELSPEEISRLLLKADIGIITTPIALAEKSGALAAMREHGLPVLALTDSWVPRGVSDLPIPEGVFNYVESELEQLFGTMEKGAPFPEAVVVITKRLVADLS